MIGSASSGLTGRLADIPRSRLAILPSPFHRVSRLATAVGGPELWLKRDDLLGFGFGGNKVRGLELILADAVAAGADTLVTGAGPQSNHVRAASAAAAVAGLRMVAVYWGTEPTASEGNLRLTRQFGAETRFTGDSDRSSVDRGIAAVAAELRSAGRQPYTIPRGGATGLGVVAHVLAARELHRQAVERGTTPELVVLAVGSGATLAGWLLGGVALDLPWRIVGYTVSRPAVEARARVSALAIEAAGLLGIDPGSIVDDRIEISEGVIGDGYGIPTAAGQAAAELLARREGILLDPTYTAKAFGGYIADANAGRFAGVDRAVFLHTGGEPALFVGPG